MSESIGSLFRGLVDRAKTWFDESWDVETLSNSPEPTSVSNETCIIQPKPTAESGETWGSVGILETRIPRNLLNRQEGHVVSNPTCQL